MNILIFIGSIHLWISLWNALYLQMDQIITIIIFTYWYIASLVEIDLIVVFKTVEDMLEIFGVAWDI